MTMKIFYKYHINRKITVTHTTIIYSHNKRSIAKELPTSQHTTLCSTLLQSPTQTRHSTPSNVSKCAHAPHALSSACSCFFSTRITRPSVTTTSTLTSTLPYCGAANHYGRLYDSPPILFNGDIQSFLSPSLGDCCKRCYDTPGCHEFLEEAVAAPAPARQMINCAIAVVPTNLDPPSPFGPSCPFGPTIVSVTARDTARGKYGLGPCGVLTGI